MDRTNADLMKDGLCFQSWMLMKDAAFFSKLGKLLRVSVKIILKAFDIAWHPEKAFIYLHLNFQWKEICLRTCETKVEIVIESTSYIVVCVQIDYDFFSTNSPTWLYACNLSFYVVKVMTELIFQLFLDI